MHAPGEPRRLGDDGVPVVELRTGTADALQRVGVGVDADQPRDRARHAHERRQEVARAARRVARHGRRRVAAPPFERDPARQLGLRGRCVDGAEGTALVATEMIGGRRHPSVL